MRRRSFTIAFLAATAVAGLAFANPAASGEGETATLTITKVVDGDGPTGGYVIEYSCVGSGNDAPEGNGGVGFGGALAFDDAGPGNPETQEIVITDAVICTVEETDSNGANTVTYDCDFEPGDTPVAPDSAFGAPAEGVRGCIDDQSGAITAPNDVLSFTVTNQFDPAVLPDDEEPPAVNPDVVAATPSFTG